MKTKQNVQIWLHLINSNFKCSIEYKQFVEEKLALVDPIYIMFGGVSELGEVADLLAKGMRTGRTFDYPKFIDELGDCLFYFVASSGKNDICEFILQRLVDLSEVADINYGNHELIEPSIKALERINMDKLNKRLADTGSHLK